MLVTALLQSIASTPLPYGTSPPLEHDDVKDPALSDDQSLAHACIVSDSTAPRKVSPVSRSSTSHRFSAMDFNVDFGSTSGFKSHAKKKKGAAPQKFDPWGDEEKKDATNDNGAGGDDGLGGGSGGGDAGGAGGGGDDNNNGGNDDDDAWGFSTGKKSKKKPSKKKQEEEEEEERKRKEEEEANGSATNNADPLSWADDANGDATNEDWTMSWGGTKKKDKTKKVSDHDPLPTLRMGYANLIIIERCTASCT